MLFEVIQDIIYTILNLKQIVKLYKQDKEREKTKFRSFNSIQLFFLLDI